MTAAWLVFGTDLARVQSRPVWFTQAGLFRVLVAARRGAVHNRAEVRPAPAAQCK